MPSLTRLLQLALAAGLVVGCTAAPPATPSPTVAPPTPPPPTATPAPATPTPAPATPSPPPTPGATPAEGMAFTGRIVNHEHGYALTLPDGWLRVELDEAFLDALTDELGSEEAVGEFLAQFGEQLRAMVAAGMSLIAFREEGLLTESASNLNVLILPSGGMSLDALESLNIAQIQTLPAFGGEIESERVELPAGEAVYLTYTLADGETGARIHQYLFVAEGNQYWLTVTGRDGDPTLEADARAMAQSLEILPD